MPQFDAGVSKIAKAVMQNPTGKAFDYDGVILMGTGLTEVSRVPFHLNANESKEISFPVVMPSVAGTYPVYIGVFSGGKSIALYKAAEDIVVVASLVFTLGTPIVTVVSCASAPAFRVADVVCDITNSNSVVVTRKVSLRWAYQSNPSQLFDRYWSTAQDVWRTLTLNPGQTFRLVSPGNLTDDWSNSPLYGTPQPYFYYYLRDDLGNSSPATLG